MIDTCQAASMFSKIYSPNILAAASSKTGESSYSHHVDFDIGVSVIDRFTYYTLETLEELDKEDDSSLQQLFNTYDPIEINSHPQFRLDLFRRSPSNVINLTLDFDHRLFWRGAECAVDVKAIQAQKS